GDDPRRALRGDEGAARRPPGPRLRRSRGRHPLRDHVRGALGHRGDPAPAPGPGFARLSAAMWDAVEAGIRAAYPRALAVLIRLLGDFTAAEDALQDAVARALEVWPTRGLPDHAAAWLVTTARRRHIDVVRRRRLEERHAQRAVPLLLVDEGTGPEAQ